MHFKLFESLIFNEVRKFDLFRLVWVHAVQNVFSFEDVQLSSDTFLAEKISINVFYNQYVRIVICVNFGANIAFLKNNYVISNERIFIF